MKLLNFKSQAGLFILLGWLTMGQLFADPPRLLHTTFEQYTKYQQQRDTQLLANDTAQQLTSGAAKTNSSKPKVSAKKPSTQKSSSSKKDDSPININQADELALVRSLIGIGPAKAKAIIEYRKQNGLFKQVEDLMLVKGIGNATLEKNRDRLRLD